MKNSILTFLLLTASLVNADTLKNDEFDLNKLGTTFEKYVIHTNDKFKSLYKQIEQLKNKVEQLENNKTVILVQKDKSILSKQDESLSTKKVINRDIRIVDTKKGIIVYSEPFSIEELAIKRYKYNEILEIEYCNEYGWCKIKYKDEYVAEYLLIQNETN